MNGHHLILGELHDFITGATLKDTHDERYRQKIARLLVNRKGYRSTDIEPRRALPVQAGEKRATVKIDFLVNLSGRICMIIKYGPGSLVTRRRPVLAASRVLAPYQIPVAVVTNGEDAEVLEGSRGSVLAVGLENIPSKSELQKLLAAMGLKRSRRSGPRWNPESCIAMKWMTAARAMKISVGCNLL